MITFPRGKGQLILSRALGQRDAKTVTDGFYISARRSELEGLDGFKAECQEHKISDSVCLLHLALVAGFLLDENKSILTNELE